MKSGQALKTAAVYAIPWFVLSLIIGMALSYGLSLGGIVFPASWGWILSGILSALLTWFVWLWQGIDKHLDKTAKKL